MSSPASARPLGRRLLRWVAIGTVQLAILVCVVCVGTHFVVPRDQFVATGDTIWGWRPRDGVVLRRSAATSVSRPRRFMLYTDSRGARVESRGDETEAPVDVMTIGCSFAFGWGLPAEETFARVLSRELGVRMANLGIPGGGTVSALRALERNRDLAPRVVIYEFIEDHTRRNLSGCAPIPAPGCMSVPHVEWARASPRITDASGTRADFDDAFRFARIMRANRLVDSPLIAWRGVRSLFWMLTHPPDDPGLVESLGPLTLRFVLSTMAAETRRLGAALVILFVSERLDSPLAAPPNALLDALPEGAVFVDFTPIARAYRADHAERLTLPSDLHPNAVAHRLIAQALEPAVREALSARPRR